MQVQSLGQEDPLEKEIATHSSQHSYPNNPMDSGGRQTTVQRVSESNVTKGLSAGRSMRGCSAHPSSVSGDRKSRAALYCVGFDKPPDLSAT